MTQSVYFQIFSFPLLAVKQCQAARHQNQALSHFLELTSWWLWVGHYTSLSLSFFICKIRDGLEHLGPISPGDLGLCSTEDKRGCLLTSLDGQDMLSWVSALFLTVQDTACFSKTSCEGRGWEWREWVESFISFSYPSSPIF